MPYLTAAVIALAILTVFNTMLCLAVIRRLRSASTEPHTEEDDPFGAPAPGTPIGWFSLPDASGDVVTEADVADATVLMLSVGCGPCSDVVDGLATVGAELPGPVYAFVQGVAKDPDVAAFAARLPDGVHRVFVPELSQFEAGFGRVRSFPTLLRVQGGVVQANAVSLDELVQTTSHSVTV